MTRAYSSIFQQTFDHNESQVQLKAMGQGDPPLAPALLIAVCVLLGLYARPLIAVVELTVTQMGDPMQYIRAVLGA